MAPANPSSVRETLPSMVLSLVSLSDLRLEIEYSVHVGQTTWPNSYGEYYQLYSFLD